MRDEQKTDQGATPQRSPVHVPEAVPQLSHVGRVRLPVRIVGHTLIGGTDNPNCFTLEGGVRIINMHMGPFQRVVQLIGAQDVEVELRARGIGRIVDIRFPLNEMHDERWCTVCCPFTLLPEHQQREYLRHHTPHIREGEITSFMWCAGVINSDEQIEAWLTEIGSGTSLSEASASPHRSESAK